MPSSQSVLVKYYQDLQIDQDIAYPEQLGIMHQSGIDFEVSKLYEHILRTTPEAKPFIMDSHEEEIVRLFASEDDSIRVSAILSLIAIRVPHLQLRSRL